MIELDTLDRGLLDEMQSDFPLTPTPYAALGMVLGLKEDDVLARVRRLKEDGVIRQIGAIFDTRRLGYRSTLAAFHVPEEKLDGVAALVNAHPGVSHNYARPHHYSLWFTLAVAPGVEILDELKALARHAGVDDWLYLPTIRVFKIKTNFRLGEDSTCGGRDARSESHKGTSFLEERDIPFVRALQEDLAVISRPFLESAERLGLQEEGLLAKAQALESAGIMRRFGAVLRHRTVGYTANGMACWIVPEERIEEIGTLAATFYQVSHCYHRPASPPRWPYTLFTMIHGQTQTEVEAIVAEIAHKTGIEAQTTLYSTREFKKERVRYFEEKRNGTDQV